MPVSRRGFVFLLSALPFVPPATVVRSVSAESRGEFDEQDRRFLEGLCEQIFPRDDFPGAIELGVPDFIERCLEAGHPDWKAIYRAGFRSTDLSARSVFGRGFLEISFDEQTQILVRMENSQLPEAHWKDVTASNFFRMIRDHTMQGAYSHPKYGGNRGKAAWDMIGYYDFWVG